MINIYLLFIKFIGHVRALKKYFGNPKPNPSPVYEGNNDPIYTFGGNNHDNWVDFILYIISIMLLLFIIPPSPLLVEYTWKSQRGINIIKCAYWYCILVNYVCTVISSIYFPMGSRLLLLFDLFSSSWSFLMIVR